eukprot:scaffold238121_cov42-Prasinocladus_malaysianus.AAC.1
MEHEASLAAKNDISKSKAPESMYLLCCNSVMPALFFTMHFTYIHFVHRSFGPSGVPFVFCLDM